MKPGGFINLRRPAELRPTLDANCEAAQSLAAGFGEHGGFVVELSGAPAFGSDIHFLGVVNGAGTFEVGGRAVPVDTLHRAWSAPLAEVYG